MFSSNLKRSVATLGVVAGLLAAAAPASHAWTWGLQQSGNVVAPPLQTGPASKSVNNMFGGDDAVRGTQVGSEGVKAPTNAPAPIDSGPGDDNIIWNDGDGTDVDSLTAAEANGTQVGSEGVKGNDGAPGREPLSGYSFGASQTGTSNYSWGASQTGTMDIMKNYDMASPY